MLSFEVFMRLDCSFLVVQVDHLEGCVLSHLNICCMSKCFITAFKHICTTSATSLTVILLMHSWSGYWLHHRQLKQTARPRVCFQRFDVVSGGRKSIVAILFHDVSCASLLAHWTSAFWLWPARALSLHLSPPVLFMQQAATSSGNYLTSSGFAP